MDISTPDETRTLQSRTYTVNDIAAILGIGRSSACKLANSGLFKTIHIGNMIRISRKFFEDWMKMEGWATNKRATNWYVARLLPKISVTFSLV